MGKKKKASGSNGHSFYTSESVKPIANGRWPGILSAIGGIPSHVLDGKHHPCPKSGCASRTDAFRFSDMDGDGSAICNQCGKFGNGFDVLVWITGHKFYEVVVMVAEHLGVPPSNNNTNHKSNGKPDADPVEKLTFIDWDEGNELLAAYWCTHKKPIMVAAIKTCGGRIADYEYFGTKLHVIAIPIWGENLTAEKPVGWSLYNLTGGTLPGPKGRPVKIKLTYGSTKPGLMGPVDQLAAATDVWKLEGPSDLLAFYSLADIPTGVVAVTNKSGAGEKPAEWMIKLLAEKRVYVLHDADEPGQRGAVGHRDEKKKWHRGWCGYAHGTAAAVMNVALPYPVTDTNGKDLRDFLGEIPA